MRLPLLACMGASRCGNTLIGALPYNGNNPRKKMFHEKTFANGDKHSRIYSFLVQSQWRIQGGCNGFS